MSPIAQLARGSANVLAENETSAGTKRRHRETGVLIENNITADEMAFKKQAFDYQKEALELCFNHGCVVTMFSCVLGCFTVTQHATLYASFIARMVNLLEIG